MHERSRLVRADPARSRVTWENDSAEQTSGSVIRASAALQNRERRAASLAGSIPVVLLLRHQR